MTDRIKKMTPTTKPDIAEIATDPVIETLPEPQPGLAPSPDEPTEAAVEVSSWAMHQSTPEVGGDLTLLGGFVKTMRARGKAAAKPSEYVRLLHEFANEEAS